MIQVTAHVHIAGQFLRISGCGRLKGRRGLAHHFFQPHVTEIHEFRILDITEIGSIRQNRIQ